MDGPSPTTGRSTAPGLAAAGAVGAALALVAPPLLDGDAPSAALVTVAVALAATALLTAVLAWRRPADDARAGTSPAEVTRAEVTGTETTRPTVLQRAAAHEVAGPLAVALGHVDLVAADPAVGDAHRASLEAALRSVRRAITLVTELVADPSAQPTHDGDDDATTGTVDLTAIVQEAVRDVAPLAARRQIAISLDATGPHEVVGDPSRLRQVVDNLLSNAVKYASDAGWADVLLTPADDSVLLQVTNAGTTLTPDEAEHAFEVEFRAAATVASPVPGSGIGLAVVRDLVTRHGGTVGLTSDPEVGTTTVKVLLPRT